MSSLSRMKRFLLQIPMLHFQRRELINKWNTNHRLLNTIKTFEAEVVVVIVVEEATQAEVVASLSISPTSATKADVLLVKSEVDLDTLLSSATTDLTTTTKLMKPSPLCK